MVASDIEVFKETLRDSYFSFDPKDETSMLNAIRKVISAKRTETKKLTSAFSFDQMAKETVDVYKKVSSI